MAIRETWPCADCGHKHYASQECADHQWTDSCPYEGLDCPDDVLFRKAAQEVELAVLHGENPTMDDFIPPPVD